MTLPWLEVWQADESYPIPKMDKKSTLFPRRSRNFSRLETKSGDPFNVRVCYCSIGGFFLGNRKPGLPYGRNPGDLALRGGCAGKGGGIPGTAHCGVLQERFGWSLICFPHLNC